MVMKASVKWLEAEANVEHRKRIVALTDRWIAAHVDQKYLKNYIKSIMEKSGATVDEEDKPDSAAAARTILAKRKDYGNR